MQSKMANKTKKTKTFSSWAKIGFGKTAKIICQLINGKNVEDRQRSKWRWLIGREIVLCSSFNWDSLSRSLREIP